MRQSLINLWLRWAKLKYWMLIMLQQAGEIKDLRVKCRWVNHAAERCNHRSTYESRDNST